MSEFALGLLMFQGVVLFVIFIFYLIACFVVGTVASKRGHSAVPWFFCAFFLTPLFGAVAVAGLPISHAVRPARGGEYWFLIIGGIIAIPVLLTVMS